MPKVSPRWRGREQKQRAYSRFRGVTYDKRRGQWAARLETGGRCHHLGFFKTEEPAAVAYDRETRRVFGAKAKLNFHPRTGEELLGRRV